MCLQLLYLVKLSCVFNDFVSCHIFGHHANRSYMCGSALLHVVSTAASISQHGSRHETSDIAIWQQLKWNWITNIFSVHPLVTSIRRRPDDIIIVIA